MNLIKNEFSKIQAESEELANLHLEDFDTGLYPDMMNTVSYNDTISILETGITGLEAYGVIMESMLQDKLESAQSMLMLDTGLNTLSTLSGIPVITTEAYGDDITVTLEGKLELVRQGIKKAILAVIAFIKKVIEFFKKWIELALQRIKLTISNLKRSAKLFKDNDFKMGTGNLRIPGGIADKLGIVDGKPWDHTKYSINLLTLEHHLEYIDKTILLKQLAQGTMDVLKYMLDNYDDLAKEGNAEAIKALYKYIKEKVFDTVGMYMPNYVFQIAKDNIPRDAMQHNTVMEYMGGTKIHVSFQIQSVIKLSTGDELRIPTIRVVKQTREKPADNFVKAPKPLQKEISTVIEYVITPLISATHKIDRHKIEIAGAEVTAGVLNIAFTRLSAKPLTPDMEGILKYLMQNYKASLTLYNEPFQYVSKEIIDSCTALYNFSVLCYRQAKDADSDLGIDVDQVKTRLDTVATSDSRMEKEVKEKREQVAGDLHKDGFGV